MTAEDKALGIICLIIIIGGAAWWYHDSTKQEITTPQRKEHPIYHCTAPFGMIWVEETTQGTFLFIVGGYYSTATLTESYNVKSFDGDELKTRVFDATKISVIPDGEFYLEEIWSTRSVYSRTGKLIGGPYDSRELYGASDPTWIIHIPELPKLNQTISMEWTFVGS